MADYHFDIRECSFLVDEGCHPTREDIARGVYLLYPTSPVVEKKSFRVSKAQDGYRVTEMTEN